MTKFCPVCKKEVEVYTEITDPKGNGYQLCEERFCGECEYEFEPGEPDYGEMIDRIKDSMEDTVLAKSI